MADFNNQERKPLPKTAFDEMKLRLEGKLQEGQRRPPNLRVSVIRNNPRIDVFTNIEGDRDNGRISAPMDGLTFFALIVKVEEIAAGEPDVQVKISNKVGKPGEQRIVSHTIVGKDKEGRCFISVVAQDRPKIKFTFLPSDWHELAHRDGTPFGEDELSCVYAKAWAKIMSELAPNVMDHHFEERVYNKPGQGGGGYNKGAGGGYQNRNKGGGNQNRNQGAGPGDKFGGSHNDGNADFDDDFPM